MADRFGNEGAKILSNHQHILFKWEISGMIG